MPILVTGVYWSMSKTMLSRQKKLSAESVKEIVSWVQNMAPWSVFATHTFKRPIGVFETSKRYEKFMCRVLPSVTYFYSVEENPSGDGGHHVHAMWAQCDDVLRREVWKKWFHQYGRCRIEPIRNSSQTTGYCSKYVTKENALWGFQICSSDLWTHNGGLREKH